MFRIPASSFRFPKPVYDSRNAGFSMSTPHSAGSIVLIVPYVEGDRASARFNESAIARRSIVLPDPLMPTSAETVPDPNESVTSFKTPDLRKVFETWLTTQFIRPPSFSTMSIRDTTIMPTSATQTTINACSTDQPRAKHRAPNHRL